MKDCPFCGAEARRSIAPAKGHPMGTYIATIRCGNPHCGAVMDGWSVEGEEND